MTCVSNYLLKRIMWSSSDDEDRELLYRCKRCPGQQFTAAERDAHRAMHIQDKRAKDENNQPDRQYVALIKHDRIYS